jgi:hypothetical protein
MTPGRTWEFPLLVLAASARGSALVAMEAPFSVDACASWRKPSSRHVLHTAAWLEPRTILVTHASRWRAPSDLLPMVEEIAPIADATIEVLGLEEACAMLECKRSLCAVAERLIDMYPETAAHLSPFIESKLRTERARKARPRLSALAAAHAASVAHLIQHG